MWMMALYTQICAAMFVAVSAWITLRIVRSWPRTPRRDRHDNVVGLCLAWSLTASIAAFVWWLP